MMKIIYYLLRLVGLHQFATFKMLYFIMYSGFGVLQPYAPVYYELMKLSKSQIGILTMMPNFCSFLVAPLFSALSDFLHAHYEMVIFCMITSTIAMTSTLLCKSFGSFILVVLISSILRAPVSPNVDALVMASLTDKTRYGEMRLWGAISYGIFSLVGGLMTASNIFIGEETSSKQLETESKAELTAFRYVYLLHAVFFIASGFIVLYIVYNQLVDRDLLPKIRFHALSRTVSLINLDDERIQALTSDLPKSVSSSLKVHNNNSIIISSDKVANDGDDSPDTNKQSDNGKPNVMKSFVQVFRDHPSVGIFAVVVFLSGFGSGIIEAFLFLRLKQLGGTGLVMGVSRFITCASEVPMFQIAGSLHQKYGTWAMLTVTQFAFVVRFLYYSLLTTPWAILPCEVLHGLTFAVTWSVSCTFANIVSPPECHTTMQALLEGLHWGFGSGMGALIGGYLYDNVGAVRLFQMSALLSLGSMGLAVFALLTFGRRDDQGFHSETTTETGNINSNGIQLSSSEVMSKRKEKGETIVYSSLLRNTDHECDGVDDEGAYI